jgi:hypothetical protein
MTEILHFELNVPAEVALAGPGIAIEGRYGNRVMYTLADNRVMYVAPIVACRISDLGIEPGELFQVCKQERREGQRKLIEWQVQRLLSEPETQLEHELRESIKVAQAARGTQPSEAGGEPGPQPPPPAQAQEPAVPQTTAPNFTVAPPSNGAGNGTASSAARNGNGQPACPTRLEHPLKAATSAADDAGANSGCAQEHAMPPVPAPTPAVVPISNSSASGSQSSAPKNGNNRPPATTKLEHALKTAISAAHNAERFGAELGYVVRFDADAIKSMAITVLINMSGESRR